MPAPFIILRVLLGVLCIFFAYGKAMLRKHCNQIRDSILIAWVLRTLVTGLGVFWRVGVDAFAIAVSRANQESAPDSQIQV